MITPVLLCGGSGKRLWPVSRSGFPKQFVPLIGGESLFAGSILRFAGEGFAAPFVVSGAQFRFLVAEELLRVGVDPGCILIEPASRNTAPAILAAALKLAETDPDGLLLLVPSDHVIPDTTRFREAVSRGVAAARAGRIIAFGIRPSRPETGYGWLELGAPVADGPVPLKSFVEKPDRTRAAHMLAAGNFLWNSGIFLAMARTLIEAAQEHAAALMEPVRDALQQAKPDLGFLRLAREPWSRAEAISIDYAVMERARNISAVAYDGEWSDLGSWDAVASAMGADAKGLSQTGAVTAIDCRDSLLRADSKGVELVAIGLDGIIAVAMNDAVLVADRSRSQDVKAAVEMLKAKGAKQAETFAFDHRPWGHYETLAVADRFQVKRILVKPGGALSLQSHFHRAEHWVVVSGTARVTVNGEVRLLSENESIYIPLGAVHRLENPGKVPMVLIEVQTGVYLGEDDILRHEDAYARIPDAE